MKKKYFLSHLYIALAFTTCSPDNSSSEITWQLSTFVETPGEGVSISGNPHLADSPYGKTVIFDGIGDAIIIENVPISGLTQFTVEAIIRPDSGGLTAQRFLHIGETDGDRVLLETRLTDTHWYFDGYIKSGESDLTLLDPDLLHPLNQWYHVAYVCDNGHLSTYVNGKKELEGKIEVLPIATGKTSIGVRQNLMYWYKGAIYKIRVSPKALSPGEFLVFERPQQANNY
jgi:hypothetical protein